MDYKIVEVSTGEVKTGASGTTLTVSALGSCIAVIAYDPEKSAGGIAHVMLPGSAGAKSSCAKLRYAEDAIAELLLQMSARGSVTKDIRIILAGGANVLERQDDTVCGMNILSALETLKRKDFIISAQSLGGVKRRRIRFDIAEGIVFCARGDDLEAVLWEINQERSIHNNFLDTDYAD